MFTYAQWLDQEVSRHAESSGLPAAEIRRDLIAPDRVYLRDYMAGQDPQRMTYPVVRSVLGLCGGGSAGRTRANFGQWFHTTYGQDMPAAVRGTVDRLTAIMDD